ncbi:hypothetical protein DMUE_3302 [Dictyocoela muelleri]|nr:hypothetical protein DMUE_3302 [Dictyocoela muelleri]
MTIMNIKRKLRSQYAKYIHTHPVFLGGPGKILQIDETVISRRGIIMNPTTHLDEIADTVWILGIIECDNKDRFFLKRLPDRRISTITQALEGIVHVGSILCSDGYPSYPAVAENLCLEHRVVNHSRDFVNEEGEHTNDIESFWSHLKSSMRKENGVKRINIDEWLGEYTFKRRYIVNSEEEDFQNLFVEILKLLFND